MAEDVQLDEPAAVLLATARSTVPTWLRRITVDAASRAERLPDQMDVDIEQMVQAVSVDLLDRLAQLLATDVDQQATNPLSILRGGVAAPTALLRSCGVPLPRGDAFASERFPDDVYRLGPATWSDVDPALHEPGLAWGAWKAMTVLRRRRDEGLR